MSLGTLEGLSPGILIPQSPSPFLTTVSSGSEFEEFARDCVRLATQANSPQLREKLFDIAREWMRAAMDGENARRSTPPASGGNTRQRLLTVDEPYAEKGIATDA
jgi:hypothetical protein